jgi:transcriptional regulator with XRE-family HTH domain
MGNSTKKAFAGRLVKAMLAAGHRSSRGAKAGVAVAELAEAAEITREMARRYVLGEAIPDTDRLDKIAGWLGVKVAWLRDGEPAPANRTEQPLAPYLPEEALEIARVWILLPSEIQDRYRSMLFTDAVMHSVLPWLRQHKPRGERYADFERSVQQDFEKLGAQLPLNI